MGYSKCCGAQNYFKICRKHKFFKNSSKFSYQILFFQKISPTLLKYNDVISTKGFPTTIIWASEFLPKVFSSRPDVPLPSRRGLRRSARRRPQGRSREPEIEQEIGQKSCVGDQQISKIYLQTWSWSQILLGRKGCGGTGIFWVGRSQIISKISFSDLCLKIVSKKYNF